jgi:hypothetical protein
MLNFERSRQFVLLQLEERFLLPVAELQPIQVLWKA